MPVSFKELLDAFVTSDIPSEEQPFVCWRTGQIYWQFDEMISGIPPDELPDDIDDEAKYFQLPNKRELGLGKPLALDFARQFLFDDFDDVREIFSRRGAYKRFQALLIRRGRRDKWHAFVAEAEARALREWCEDNEIELSD